MNRTSLTLFAALVLGAPACSSSSTDSAPQSGGAAGSAGNTNGGSSHVGGSGGGGAGGAAQAGGGSANGGANNAGSGGASGGSAGAAGSSHAGASGGGAAGNGGNGGAAAYDPCPTNGDACRVMPLGDSITDGCCGENTVSQGASYRLALFQLALTNHKKLTFVGSHTSGPATVNNVAFPQHQEGHPGWTIADGGGRSGLQQQIVGWLAATPPDIVTLMIGTNDVDIKLDLANAPQRLSTLIDTITSTSPKALVVVAQIVPTQNDDENERDQTFNAAIPGVVKTFADAGKHVTMVDMYDAYTKNQSFKTELLANALHPTDAGYQVMANVWWAAIDELLPND